MNIMFAGHLDRAFLLGRTPDRFRGTPAEQGQSLACVPSTSFFHRAAMLAALSEGVVQPIDRVPDGERTVSHRDRAGRIYDSISQAELEDDALRLAKLSVAAGAYSDETKALMRLRAPDDPHEPNIIHHAEGVLFYVLHAWRTSSTLVLTRCDWQVLVELVNCVLAEGIALPFGIPDLRKISLSDPRLSGPIPNLEPGDMNDCNAFWKDPHILAYRHRLRRLAISRTVNAGTLLGAAFEEACRNSLRMRNAPADFTLTSAWVRSIDTRDLRSPRVW